MQQLQLLLHVCLPVVPQKVERSIFVTVIFKHIAMISSDISSDKTLSSEKNDTKIIWFSSVVLILQPFLETQSFTNYVVKCARAMIDGYSCPYMFSLCFCLHGSKGFRATMYWSQKSHYPWLKCHENKEKIDNDYVWRNDHRIKTTQPISMILVSFFSEDSVLSDEIKIY